jgi:hypothetical protein
VSDGLVMIALMVVVALMLAWLIVRLTRADWR